MDAIIEEYKKINEENERIYRILCELTDEQQKYYYESILYENKKRMTDIEKTSEIIGGETDRIIMFLKLCSGMDTLEKEQREESFKFADAISRMGGISAPKKTDAKIRQWVSGEVSYSSLFREALTKYGLIPDDIFEN